MPLSLYCHATIRKIKYSLSSGRCLHRIITAQLSEATLLWRSQKLLEELALVLASISLHFSEGRGLFLSVLVCWFAHLPSFHPDLSLVVGFESVLFPLAPHRSLNCVSESLRPGRGISSSLFLGQFEREWSRE
ncbi:hypothetical protein F2Q68_00012404 [Brassica cretica]|uniref:Uncharacterized protein n=1 Tax=Brassica cretica TaxID=69181 RepID=A0A8S9L0G6_BRACR|nr:hypothetical protein F2Q68_00012404 [Brassica cretica]